MTFGVVGATGATGAAGPLSGLTCGANEFAASFSGVWQCAVLRVTADGIFSGDGSPHPNMMNDLISNGGYSAVGLNTNVWCYEWDCTFEVVGVADHTVCTISGAIGVNSFNTGSPGVVRTVNNIFVDWSTATGVSLNGNGAVSVQVSCGQGVIPAP